MLAEGRDRWAVSQKRKMIPTFSQKGSWARREKIFLPARACAIVSRGAAPVTLKRIRGCW